MWINGCQSAFNSNMISQSLSAFLRWSLFVPTASAFAPKILWSGTETTIPGVSPQRLLMLVEAGKPEHRDCFRTMYKTKFHRVPSRMVPIRDSMGVLTVLQRTMRTSAVAAQGRLGLLQNEEELTLRLATGWVDSTSLVSSSLWMAVLYATSMG